LSCHKCGASLRKQNGCDGYLKPERFKYDPEIVIDKCIKKIITRQSYVWLDAFDLYKKGFLPNGNSWLNESIKFIKIMQFIDVTISEIKRKESKER
jgi:hypothetical protein